MSYKKYITVRMDGTMHADLMALVNERQTDVGKLMRQLIARELLGTNDRIAEALDQVLFTAIAMEGLLDRHTDPNLRGQVLQVWRDRLAAEGRPHAA